jgi:hypothetical protein
LRFGPRVVHRGRALHDGASTSLFCSSKCSGDRFLTPWLLVLGRRLAPVAYVDMELVHAAGSVHSVRARVHDLPVPELMRHAVLAAQWMNASHWPKPLLVQYRWVQGEEVHTDRGLLVIFAAGRRMGVRGLGAWGDSRNGMERIAGTDCTGIDSSTGVSGRRATANPLPPTSRSAAAVGAGGQERVPLLPQAAG